MKRLKDLYLKLFSVKGLVFTLATVEFFQGKIPWYGWLLSSAYVVGIRFIEKLFKVGFWRS